VTEVHEAAFEDLSTTTLYEILRLRVDVFVVEQDCAYPELDGLDEGARHYWIRDGEAIGAYLRVIDDGNERRITRVVTRVESRANKLARTLMEHVLATTHAPWVLSAQTYLRGWYAGFGFVEVGEDYVEDGIPHIDMRRDV